MSGNICGNCSNFKPQPGEKVFNCLVARHAGIKYSMQVRNDTASCEAFAPLRASPAPSKLTALQAQPARKEPPPRRGLCPWGRAVIIALLLLLLLLVVFGIYTCASGARSTPSPTPRPSTPAATPTPTQAGGLPAPLITPIPVATVPATIQLQVGQPAMGGGEYILVDSVSRTKCVPAVMGQWCQPPPGTSYVAVAVTILNNGGSPFGVGKASFVLRDSSGGLYKGSSALVTLGLSSTFTLNPGAAVADTLYFTVPDIATGLAVYAQLITGQLVIWVSSA
jgi:hypothetical protein